MMTEEELLELDKQVAFSLGHRLSNVFPETEFDDTVLQMVEWILPDGRVKKWQLANIPLAFDSGWYGLQRWSKSLDAAVTLAYAEDLRVELIPQSDNRTYAIVSEVGYYGDTPAEAVCRAWLAWKAKQIVVVSV